MPLQINPDQFLQHGGMGVLLAVFLVGAVMSFRLINRLIDTLQSNSNEQVQASREQTAALIAVEKAVKESVEKAESRHGETQNAFLESARLIADTREAMRTWTDRCRHLCGHHVSNGKDAAA